MLLRSASTPVLNSWIPQSSPRESPIESDFFHQFPRARPVMLSASTCCCYSPMSVPSSDDSTMRMSRAMSENDLRDLSTKPGSKFRNSATIEEKEEGIGFGLLRTSSLECGLGLSVALEGGCEVSPGASGGGCGGKIYGGGGYGGGSDGGDGDGGCNSWNWNHGNDGTDVYYQMMIKANPGNSLILGNYAKFLIEARRDFEKAEEYCGRAILANPNDGNVLSMYAELMWQSYRDSSRAQTFFDRAVKAAPDDCYVLASYARFLWDAEEEDDDEQEGKEEELNCQTSQLNFFNGPPPITAAS